MVHILSCSPQNILKKYFLHIFYSADLGGQLPGPDRGSDEGQDHRGGQEGAGGQRAERRRTGENPTTQSR